MIASLVIGFFSGWLHLHGLRLTLERLPESRSPRGWVMMSRLIRTALTLALFYSFCLPHLPFALAAWWLARTLVVQRWN